MAEPFDFRYDEYAGLDLTDLNLVDVLFDDAAIEALRHDDGVPAQDPVLASLTALARTTAVDLPEPVHRSSGRVRAGVRVGAAAVTALAFVAGTGIAAARSDDPFTPIRDFVQWGLTLGEGIGSPSGDVERRAAKHLAGTSPPRPNEPQIVASRQFLIPQPAAAEARPEVASEGREVRTGRDHQPSRGGDRERAAANDHRPAPDRKTESQEETENQEETEDQKETEDQERFTLLTEGPDQEPSGGTEEPDSETPEEETPEDSGEETPEDSGEETQEDEPEDPGPSPSAVVAPR